MCAAAAADPGELLALDHLHHPRQQHRVAAAPHEARADHDRFEAVSVRVAYRLLGLRLRPGVGGGRVGPQRRCLVHVDERLPGHQCGLGPDVDEPPHARFARRGKRIARSPDRDLLELLGRTPVADLGGGVERDLGAVRSRAQRRRVGQVASHRLRARVGHRLRRAVGASERLDGPAVANQAADQRTADESGSAGHECGRHVPGR
jgi:hypothetical protein